MKLFIFIFTLFFCFEVRASWVNMFGVSDQEYKIYIVGEERFKTTTGYYLTSFPCYSLYNKERYKTVPGKNMITLFCVEPPARIYLSYVTRPLGAFVSANEKADGYMVCPVGVLSGNRYGIIPNLEIDMTTCEKKQVGATANRDILKRNNEPQSDLKIGEEEPEENLDEPERLKLDEKISEKANQGIVQKVQEIQDNE